MRIICLSKNKFDIVIIQAVLEHVINPSKVSEIYRVLSQMVSIRNSIHAECAEAYDFTRFFILDIDTF